MTNRQRCSEEAINYESRLERERERERESKRERGRKRERERERSKKVKCKLSRCVTTGIFNTTFGFLL
jgi:hypothetical protein